MEFLIHFLQKRNKKIVSAILAATFIYSQSNANIFGSIFSFFKNTANQAVSSSAQQSPQISDFANAGNLVIIPGITDSVKKSFFTPKVTFFTILGVSVCLGILCYFKKKAANKKIFDKSITHNAIIMATNLIKDGKIDVNEKCDGQTALHVACEMADEEAVKFLIEKGANLNAINDKGFTPLQCICENRLLGLADEAPRFRIAKLLIEKASRELGESDAKKTINNKAHNSEFYSAAALALSHGYKHIYSLLIKNGAKIDINVKTFINAMRKGDLETIKHLIEFGFINVNASDCSGKTALHLACQKGDLDFVKYLIEKRANVNSTCKDGLKNEGGHTPLIMVCKSEEPRNEQERLEIIKILLQNGAKTTIDNKISGNSAVSFALSENYIDIFKFLISEHAKISRDSVKKAIKDDLEFIFRTNIELGYWLIENDIINTEEKIEHARMKINGFFTTPLFHAIASGDLDFAKYLVNIKHVNIANINHNGQTALELACEWCDLNMIRWLIEERGMNINEVYKSDLSPIHIICTTNKSESDAIRVIEFFAHKDPKMLEKLTKKTKKSPLDLACKYGNLNIAKFLIISGASKTIEVGNKKEPKEDENVIDKQKEDLVFKLIKENKSKELEEFLTRENETFDFDAQNEDGEIPLLVAHKEKKQEIVRELSKYYAKTNKPETRDTTFKFY